MAANARRILSYLGLVDGPDFVEEPYNPLYHGDMPGHEDLHYSGPQPRYIATPPAPTNSVAATVTSFAAAATAPTPSSPRAERTEAARSAAARITTVHPMTYNDARNIGDDFRAGIPVIMNVSEMDIASATRMVDFAAGLTYGLKGSVERISAGVFLLTPANYDLTAATRERFQDQFFNQS